MTDAGTAKGTYQNQERFPVFYRVGTGTQYVKDESGKLTKLSGAYSYKTGGDRKSSVYFGLEFCH
ncbi:adhesin autotransporter [Citrobacter braakii]|nr:adhesin autotransporter [Citrobacter braakii]